MVLDLLSAHEKTWDNILLNYWVINMYKLIITTEYNVVEYYLTDIGYSLRPVVESMQKWGKDYKKLRKLMERAGL